MSSKTKIIVLKSKELIYTGIFIVLGILLILLLWYMFSPKEDEKDTTDTIIPKPTNRNCKNCQKSSLRERTFIILSSVPRR